jgi:hypothetical protein
VSGDNIKAFYAFLVSVFALLGMVGVLGYFAMKTVSMSTIKYCRRRGGRHYPPASEPIALFLSFSLSSARARCVCACISLRVHSAHARRMLYVLRVLVCAGGRGAQLSHPSLPARVANGSHRRRLRVQTRGEGCGRSGCRSRWGGSSNRRRRLVALLPAYSIRIFAGCVMIR